MARRYSRYPIGQLLLLVLERSGLRISEFVAAVGYQNVTRGIKRFDGWLAKGTGSRQFLDWLSKRSFAPGQEELERALVETGLILEAERKKRREQLREEERRRFVPIIQGVAEFREPSSITLYGLSGGPIRQTIHLPDEIKTWESDKQADWIRDAIKNNYAKNLGRTITNGRIVRYSLYWEYGSAPVRYSVEGELVAEVDGGVVE